MIIEAGHNEASHSLFSCARMKVCVVEKNYWVGGAAVSRSLYPGFTYSNCSYVSSSFRPEIMRDLELPKHGLQILPHEGGAVFQLGSVMGAPGRNAAAEILRDARMGSDARDASVVL